MRRAVKRPILPRKADLRTLRESGTYLGTEDKAALALARAIHASESSDVSISWSAQERAQEFFNQHGLEKTLDEIVRLGGSLVGGSP